MNCGQTPGKDEARALGCQGPLEAGTFGPVDLRLQATPEGPEGPRSYLKPTLPAARKSLTSFIEKLRYVPRGSCREEVVFLLSKKAPPPPAGVWEPARELRPTLRKGVWPC